MTRWTLRRATAERKFAGSFLPRNARTSSGRSGQRIVWVIYWSRLPPVRPPVCRGGGTRAQSTPLPIIRRHLLSTNPPANARTTPKSKRKVFSRRLPRAVPTVLYYFCTFFPLREKVLPSVHFWPLWVHHTSGVVRFMASVRRPAATETRAGRISNTPAVVARRWRELRTGGVGGGRRKKNKKTKKKKIIYETDCKVTANVFRVWFVSRTGRRHFIFGGYFSSLSRTL